MNQKLAELKKPFPESAISKRAQMVSERDGKFTALALFYIDARDVMDRLDDVLGAENWQDSYVESAKGRIICTISICIDGQWISKSDGAGDTDVEAEKGAISDAFKRAAVKWGIGRDLYDRKSTWLPCTAREDGVVGGKKKYKFLAWINGYNAKTSDSSVAQKVSQSFIDSLIEQLGDAKTLDELENLAESNRILVEGLKEVSPREFQRIVTAKKNRKATLSAIKQGGLD